MFHINAVFGVLLNVPSQEQGASIRILSNSKPESLRRLHKAVPCFFVIMIFDAPQRSVFEARIFTLPSLISLAIIVPWFSIFAEICVVFEPGEAQRSRTNSPFFGFSASTGSMLEIS